MGQPVSKSDIAAARALCFDALADANYPVSAKWIASWGGQFVASHRAIQCALLAMVNDNAVARQRHNHGNEYLYSLLPECDHLGEDCNEDCDSPDHCRCFCHSCVAAFDAWNNGED